MKKLGTRQTLLERVIDQHDDAAWLDFVNYYREYLMAVLLRYGLSHADCQDVLQEALLKIWEKLPEFNYDASRGRFRSWITQITINFMRELVKKNARLGKAFEKGKLSHPDDSGACELDAIFRREWQELIARKAWENVSTTLSEHVRRSFELFVEGSTDVQIIQETGLAASSVRVYRQRVRLKLSHEIARLEAELS